MKRWLPSAALVVALLGANACDSDESDDLFDGNTGGSGGSGQGGGAGEGGTPSGDTLEDPETVRDWANTASALAVYLTVYGPFAAADGQVVYTDPACPAVTDDGTTFELTGGCTSAQGQDWVGTATVERSANGDRHLTVSGFGSSGIRDTGEASLVRIDATNHDFDVNIVNEKETLVTTYDYSGNVVGDYDTRTVWSGSGTVTREGDEHPLGRIEASTTDEVVDDVCSGQPASGNTTLEDEAGNTVVLTYDGSIDCDDDLAASYTLNGEPQGTITGIACSFSGARPQRPFVALGLLVVAAVLGARRRLSCRFAGAAGRAGQSS